MIKTKRIHYLTLNFEKETISLVNVPYLVNLLAISPTDKTYHLKFVPRSKDTLGEKCLIANEFR